MSRLPILPDAPRPLVFAHRGLSVRAPENTMAAFRLALAEGVPGIELDVRLSADNRPVVIHDRKTGRLAPEQGRSPSGFPVESTPWPILSRLDVGLWKGERWRGERMPLLDEVFEEADGRVYFDIELKSPTIRAIPLAEAVLRSIAAARKYSALGRRCIVSCFNPFTLAYFKAAAPRIPTAIIWSREFELPFFLRHGEGRWLGKVDCLKPERSLVDRSRARRWKARGWPYLAWTVDSPEEASRLARLGCDGIISNEADRLVSGKG
ncbi:MAG TPA: glycerophosphodiester phosphodiesterase [Rectinemataceae bacterium]|nr:glycerophosphodiester phosphodiesterase [Rectinemataceae bacterium]